MIYHLSRSLGLLLITSIVFVSCSKSNDNEQTETNEVQSVFVKHYQSNPPNGDLSYSFKCLTGNLSVKWEKTAKEFYPYLSRMVYGDNKLFYRSISIDSSATYPNNVISHLNAIEPNSGVVAWVKRTKPRAYFPLCYSDNVLYCSYEAVTVNSTSTNNESFIVAFNSNTGDILWEIAIPELFSPVKVISDGKSLFIIATYTYNSRIAKKLIKMNIQTRSFDWDYLLNNYNDASFFRSTLFVHGDNVYTNTWLGDIFCFNKSTGAKIWKFSTEDSRLYASNSNVYLTPILYRNQIYVNDRFLLKAYNINPSNGTLSSSWSMPRFLNDCEAYMYNNRMYVVGALPGGAVSAYKVSDGSEVFKKGFQDNYIYPIVAGNKIYTSVYITANRISLTKLMAFDANSGSPTDSILLSSAPSSGFLQNTDFQVLTTDGQFLVPH